MSLTARDRRDPLELRTLLEAQAATGQSRRQLLADIAAGRLHAVFLGLDVRVPTVELDRYKTQLRRGAA